MPLEAQYAVLDAERSNWAELAGGQHRGVFRSAGDLVLMADQQGQLIQRRLHPVQLLLNAVMMHAHAPPLTGPLALATEQQRQQLMTEADAQQLVAVL